MYKKSWKTFLWQGALQKLPNHGSKHLLYKCMYQVRRVWIIFEAMNEEKWLWPIFGHKVGQSDPTVLKLDVSCRLLDIYIKFQIGISKYVEKSPGNMEK